MSMAEPLMPHHSSDDEQTTAAEPGAGAPNPQFAEEPDVDDPSEDGADASAPETRDADFVTPRPGEKLHPGDLAE